MESMIKSHYYPPLTERVAACKMNSVGLLSNVQILMIGAYCKMKREPGCVHVTVTQHKHIKYWY